MWERPIIPSRFSSQCSDLEPVNDRLLMGFILWLSKDHEEFKRVAMNKNFPKTQVLIQSVQRPVQTLIEPKDAYNIQVSQDRKTFLASRMSNAATELIRMKVHVYSDSTLCVGILNWATNLDEVWNKHRFNENLNLAFREVQLIWHVYRRQESPPT